MMMSMMIVIMAVVVTTAAFFSIMMVIVMMIMVVVVLMVMTAAALFPIMIVIMVMVMIMVAAATGIFMIVVVMMPVIVAVLMIMLLFPVVQHFLHQLLLQIGAVLAGLQDLLSVPLDDGRSDQRGPAVALPDQIPRLLPLFLPGALRFSQDNRSGVLNLVNEKFSEILDVHFALGSVHHSNGTV